jgi:hypothetical protein
MQSVVSTSRPQSSPLTMRDPVCDDLPFDAEDFLLETGAHESTVSAQTESLLEISKNNSILPVV